jgi:type II secretory pathway pseudopilin PulG
MRAVNLIPAEQRSGASAGAGQSQGAAYAVLGLLAGVALLVALYGAARHQVSSRQAQAARATQQAQQAQAAAQGLAPYTSFVAVREQRLQAVSTLVDSRFDWAHVFHEFGRVLPLGVSISSLEGTIGTPTPTGAPAASPPSPTVSAAPASSPAASSAATAAPVASATPTGSVPAFTIDGCALSQREVAVMLERLRLMDGVTAATLGSSTKSNAVGGGSGGSGGCPSGAPAFTVHISFDPLPAAPAKLSSTRTVAQASASAASAAPPTTEVSAK